MGQSYSSNIKYENKVEQSTFVQPDYQLKRIKSTPIIHYRSTQYPKRFYKSHKKVPKIYSEPNMYKYSKPSDIPIDNNTYVHDFDKYGITILNY